MQEGVQYETIWNGTQGAAGVSCQYNVRIVKIAAEAGFESKHSQEFFLQVKRSGRWTTVKKVDSFDPVVGFLITIARENTELKTRPKRKTRRKVCSECGCDHNYGPEK